MTDHINLPPLPVWEDWMPIEIGGELTAFIQKTQFDAIKFDRQQRGEPVGVRYKMKENENWTYQHNVLHTRPEGWKPYVQELLYTTPQPAAPAHLCDCERGHNGMGMVGRECDCTAPAQEPSDDDLLAIQEEIFPYLALWRSRYLEVARALLARYGAAHTSGERAVIIEETLLNVIRRLNSNSYSLTKSECVREVEAMLAAAPKFGEEQ